MKHGPIVVAAIAVLAMTLLGGSLRAQSALTNGTLVISQKGRGPLMNEGSIAFFQVYADGQLVEEKALGGKLIKKFGTMTRQSTRDGDSVSFALPPGTFELRGYIRGCDGNCDHLGDPQYECRALFNMREADEIRAVREQKSSGLCTITFSSKRK